MDSRNWTSARWAIILIHTLLPAMLCATALAEDRVLTVTLDAASVRIGEVGPAINPWSWSKEQRLAAAQYSQMSYAEIDGVRCLRVAINSDLPWTSAHFDLASTTGPDYLDPTCDAVRLRCRVLEGSFRLAVGGPTSYFATSDVLTTPVALEAGTEWRDLVIPLDGGLSRNFRRAGLGAKNPLIAYSRWIQEGLRVCAFTGSHGVLLVQRIELLAQGRGQPYPAPPAEGLPAIGPLIVPSATDPFTAFIQGDLVLTGPPKTGNANWKPAVTSIGSIAEQTAWLVQMRGAEEVSFAGCRLRVPATARALTMTVSAGPVPRAPLSLDFLILVADGEIPWSALAAPPAWREHAATAFDAFFTTATTGAASLALYHIRRAVPADTKTNLLLPWEDAVCVAGSGTCADDLLQQRPLQPERIRALLVAPSFRHNRNESRFTVSAIQPVGLPKVWSHLRSFFQPALSTLARDYDPDTDRGYGGRLNQRLIPPP